ncbi:adenylate/guanylate cyclase domain-containing protein [Desulfogranum mediterraneum]|uniref:adenylate/guanylate cyclase domain-containing protein n=1 Tax=Desulfogranum mediterraneum TaxID=160661 RepID=UPI00040E9941|nr:adenylate/guanylate cyclase domain-containing protein [Desulfogranum mediterraneum]
MNYSLLLITAPDQAQAISSALDQYSVVTCVSEQEALTMVSRQEVYLALLADDLPGVAAGKLLRQLQEISPGLSAFLLSSSADTQALNTALAEGFLGVVPQPVQTEQLVRVVAQVWERVRLQEENTRLRTLLPLYSLGEQFLSSSSEQEVLDGLLAAVSELTPCSNLSVLLFDQQRSCLQIAASRGLDKELVRSICLQPGEKIAGWVFSHGKPVILNREDQADSIFAPFLQRPDIVSSISCPLVIREKIIGVLNISQQATDRRFSEADMEMVSVVSAQAAMALENVRALTQLQVNTRLQTLLEQYMAPEVAALLLARDTDLMQLGDIQEVTILFADIRNFTTLVQHLELGILRAFLNDFFNIFTETVFEQQGSVDKFMGDAVLALFGAPVENVAANQAAVEAALTIRHRFEQLRLHWLEQSEVFVDLDLGIGVTCGSVFLGNVGSSRRFDYTVIGNEVNLAQRLAAESSQCSIYLTEAVQRDLAASYALDRLEEVQLRGIETPLPVYVVRGRRS